MKWKQIGSKMMETINDKLIKVSELQLAIKEDSKLCETLLITNFKNNDTDFNELVDVVLKNIEVLKMEQYKIMESNFNNKVFFNDKEYTILELIKIKENYKMQMDFINNMITLLDKTNINANSNNTKILLKYQLKLNELRKSNYEIQKIITNYNMQKDYNG